MSHSWTTLQVIPRTWESLSDTSHLDSSSQRFTNNFTKSWYKTLDSNVQEKLGLNGVLKICKF